MTLLPGVEIVRVFRRPEGKRLRKAGVVSSPRRNLSVVRVFGDGALPRMEVHLRFYAGASI